MARWLSGVPLEACVAGGSVAFLRECGAAAFSALHVAGFHGRLLELFLLRGTACLQAAACHPQGRCKRELVGSDYGEQLATGERLECAALWHGGHRLPGRHGRPVVSWRRCPRAGLHRARQALHGSGGGGWDQLAGPSATFLPPALSAPTLRQSGHSRTMCCLEGVGGVPAAYREGKTKVEV